MNEEILKELKDIKQLLMLRKEIWNIEDLCIYTGISKDYAYHLTSKGKLKFYRPFGKKIFFNPEIVIESLKKNESVGNEQIQSKANRILLK